MQEDIFQKNSNIFLTSGVFFTYVGLLTRRALTGELEVDSIKSVFTWGKIKLN